MKYYIRSFTSYTILLLLSACSVLLGAREVHVEVANNSTKDILKVQVHFGNYAAFPGEDCFIGKGYDKTVLGYTHASVEGAIVEWTIGESHHKKNVELKGILPKKGEGYLIFVIENDQVSARFEPRKR